MRQIERQMLGAIAAKESWQSGNTAVVYEPEVNEPEQFWTECSRVYLHGNHICTVYYSSPYMDKGPVPNRDTFSEWPTPTTASRLRALGVNASIKNFQACIDGEPV